jgi:Domain of unknown function (DUF1707)
LRSGARAHQNSTVTDNEAGSRPPSPVPSLPVPSPPAPSGSAVTDEDRNRYGLLLDRAAERGLIGPDDYRVRLEDLAAASTIEQMNRIVTELPAFVIPPVVRPRPRAPGLQVPGVTGSMGGPRRSRRSSPWLLLLIVVAVVAASLVFLTIYAEHTVRTRNSGLAPRATVALTVSALLP